MKSGVVNEYVDSPKLELRLPENVDAGFAIRDIHREYLDTDSVTQFCGNGLEFSLAARNQHQVRARRSELSRRGRTDALGPTRYDDGLVFENHWRSVSGLAGVAFVDGGQVRRSKRPSGRIETWPIRMLLSPGRANLEAKVSFDLPPERRLPAVNFEYLGIENCHGHRRIRTRGLIRGNVLWSNVELAAFAFFGLSKPIDSEAQVRQYPLLDDVVQEYGVRVEGLFRQDDALIEGFVVANGCIPFAVPK